MPIDIVHVHRVDAVHTARLGWTSHVVWTHEGPQFFTMNPFMASVCERAQTHGMAVRIAWKDGRMKTRDIVMVELEVE
jgi:hypothetical protein